MVLTNFINVSRGVVIPRDGGTDFAPWAKAQIDRLTSKGIVRSPYPLHGDEEFLDLPPGESLDPHQLESIGYILVGDDTLLGDDAGLGKTITIIVSLNALDFFRHDSRILFITPSVVKYNWKNELMKWGSIRHRPNGVNDIHVVEGDDYELAPVTIINYDLLARHKASLRATEWDAIVCDESHRLANEKANRTRVVLGHGKKVPALRARKRIFASATSMNRPAHLWPISASIYNQQPQATKVPSSRLRVMNRSDIPLGADWFAYHKEYCNAIRTPYGWDVRGASNLDKLGNKLRESFYIRHSDEVLNLRPYTESSIIIPRSQAVSDAQVSLFLALLGKAEEDKNEEALILLDRLRKARDDTSESSVSLEVDSLIMATGGSLSSQITGLFGVNVQFEEATRFRRLVGEAKIPSACSRIDDYIGDDTDDDDPLLVFAVHREVVARLAEHAAKYGTTAVINGSVHASERTEIIKGFQAGEIRTIVANVHAGGEGVTATRANRVFFVETDWNATTIRQCYKRIHRRGQVRSCHGEFLLMDKTIDANVVRSFTGKQSVIDAINAEDT